jgi:N-acetylglutamate synthase-like GNAT family acetyltransferase
MQMAGSKKLHIRKLENTDLSRIINIEERVTGIARPEYWAKKMLQVEEIRPHWASLIAELDNRVVGFLLGRTGTLEFGLPGTVAWIEIIGVDPVYRLRGVGLNLVEEFKMFADYHGIKTVFTLIENGHADMDRFFQQLGFLQGKMLHFQKQIK